MGGMGSVRGMLGDDSAIGLLRHNEPKKLFTYPIMGVRLKVGGCVFGCRGGNIVSNYWLRLSSLNRHSGERCESGAQRKHNF